MPGFKNKMGEIIFANLEELSVSDVYDLASEIGLECETLISAVGADPVNALIKKVILSLELLERYASRNEKENAAMTEMGQRIEKLETEKQQRAESRHKFEQEIETCEDQWRNESRELLSLVSRLQEENHRLLGGSSTAKTTSGDATTELETMQKVFRNEMENHKIELKRREEEINAQQEELVDVSTLQSRYRSHDTSLSLRSCLAATGSGVA